MLVTSMILLGGDPEWAFMSLHRLWGSSRAQHSLTCWWRGTAWWSTSTPRSRSTAGRSMGSSTRWLLGKKVKLTPQTQVVDMRWGVRDEMTDEHMTTVRSPRSFSLWSTIIIVSGPLHEWIERLSKIQYGTKLHLFWSPKVSTPTHCEIFLFLFYNFFFRYGYRPIPSEIDTAELLKLRTTLVGMKNDVHLMDKWLVFLTTKCSI